MDGSQPLKAMNSRSRLPSYNRSKSQTTQAHSGSTQGDTTATKGPNCNSRKVTAPLNHHTAAYKRKRWTAKSHSNHKEQPHHTSDLQKE
jgi:hypothetical protein